MVDRTSGSRQADAAVRISVLRDVVGCLEIGVGWNDSSCLHGRWPEIRAAHDGEYGRRFRRRFSHDDWDRYFGLLEWSGCHWLRHSVAIADWAASGDSGAFAFDSRSMRRHYLVLDQAERRGIRVLLANWNMGLDRSGRAPAHQHPTDAESFAGALAALVHHLKRVRRYECVWALSLWNEPDQRRSYAGSQAKYPETFWPLFETVDRHLRNAGVRDDIALLGPESTTGGRPQQIAEMLRANDSFLDVVADHDYSAFRGKAMFRSVASYEWLVQQLRGFRAEPPPLVISEFGNYGNGSGPVDDDDEVYDGALSTTAYLIRMMNKGVAGLARWEFAIYGRHWRNFGGLTNADGLHLFRPYAPVYFPHAITARYVEPGWQVRRTQVENGGDAVSVAGLTSQHADLTLIILNDDDVARTAHLTLGLERPVERLRHLRVAPPVADGITRREDIVMGRDTASMTLAPRSITVLTTLPEGDLTRPSELALRRARRDQLYDLLNRQLHSVRRRANRLFSRGRPD